MTEVVATEPNPHMLRRARRAAARAPVAVLLERAGAEALPIADGSTDTVVSTLVLCTVPHPAAALSEIARILRPGGRFLFMEHVRSERPRVARWQDRLERPWGFLAGGCHPNRDTVAAIGAAGFEIESLDSYDLGPGASLVAPHVSGLARRPG